MFWMRDSAALVVRTAVFVLDRGSSTGATEVLRSGSTTTGGGVLMVMALSGSKKPLNGSEATAIATGPDFAPADFTPAVVGFGGVI